MEVAALISAPSANGKRSDEMLSDRPGRQSNPELQQFHEDEPFLQRASRFRSAS
jgi:hypothetical protein